MVLVIFMWYTRKKEVIKMEGKFNIWQKCLEIVCFVLILASSIYKGLFCDGDMGVVITLSFVAILLFIIFSIAARSEEHSLNSSHDRQSRMPSSA